MRTSHVLSKETAERVIEPFRPVLATAMIGDLNPEMVRLARVSRGRKQAEVAAALGIRQPTYSKIENGEVLLTPENLDRLAAYLGFPPSFFRQTDRVWGTASPHHRRRHKLSPTRLEEIEARLNVVRLRVRRLRASVEIEALYEVPSISLDEVNSPAEAAREVRRLWRVRSGPIANVTALLEDAGVIIVEEEMAQTLDAISVWGFGEPPVILLNSGFPTDRKRQTLAHELGHLVMHSSDVTSDPEGEANEFARELLMPAQEIRAELVGLRVHQLPDLKRRWKCSMRNFVYHAQALGLISRDQARYLFMRLNQIYGSKNEPVEIPEEPPTLLREMLGRHFNDLGYSLDRVALVANTLTDEFSELYLPPRRHLKAL